MATDETEPTGFDPTVPHATPIPPADAVELAAGPNPLRRTLVHRNGRIIDIPPNYTLDYREHTWTAVATVVDRRAAPVPGHPRGETAAEHHEGAFTTVVVGPDRALRADHSFEDAALACHADAVDAVAGREPAGGHHWPNDPGRAER